MKPLHVYVGTGVLVFLLGLGFACPAQVLYHWRVERSYPRVHVYALNGTLWHGSAELMDASGIRLSSVEWQLHPLALLLGRLSHGVKAISDAGPINAVLSRGLGSTRISDVHGSLPTAQLEQALQLPMLLLPGRVEVNFPRLVLTKTGLESAEGVLDLNSLTWPLTTPPAALGSYHIAVTTEKHVINIALTDSAAPIELKGKAELTPASSTYTFNVQLRPRTSAPAAVVNVIQQLGNVDSEGWYRLHREGAF